MQRTKACVTKMTVCMFSVFTVVLCGCDPQFAPESRPPDQSGISDEFVENQPNEDLNTCLAVASSANAEDREVYCASLSPANRQAQCMSGQSGPWNPDRAGVAPSGPIEPHVTTT